MLKVLVVEDEELIRKGIVLAAGQGKRMKSKVQKQFLELKGKPVLYYSLACFEKSEEIQEILVVTGEESIEFVKKEIIEIYGFQKVKAVVAGGKERYDYRLKQTVFFYALFQFFVFNSVSFLKRMIFKRN